MHCFLQGERGSGKSFLLRQLLQPYEGRMAGFAVQRLIQDDGVTGFRVKNVRDGLPCTDVTDPGADKDTFIYRGERNDAVLLRMIREVEQDLQAQCCDLILLDEIGGAELCEPEFTAVLRRILNCGKPCVGVWKSASNLKSMIRYQGLPEQYLILHGEFEQELKKLGTILSYTAKNKDQCSAYLRHLLDTVDQ